MVTNKYIIIKYTKNKVDGVPQKTKTHQRIDYCHQRHTYRSSRIIQLTR